MPTSQQRVFGCEFEGLTAIVEGTDSGGFRQVLLGVGEEEIADEFEKILDSLITQLEEMEEPLGTLIETNPEKLDVFQEDLSRLTSLLKWDIATVLEWRFHSKCWRQ